jgi:hypothetical protein
MPLPGGTIATRPAAFSRFSPYTRTDVRHLTDCQISQAAPTFGHDG